MCYFSKFYEPFRSDLSHICETSITAKRETSEAFFFSQCENFITLMLILLFYFREKVQLKLSGWSAYEKVFLRPLIFYRDVHAIIQRYINETTAVHPTPKSYGIRPTVHAIRESTTPNLRLTVALIFHG